MKLDRPVFSWALYDWANSAFATTVMAVFFPILFKEYWSPGDDPTVSTFRLGVVNSAASLGIAVVAPVLGAIADRGSTKKKFLLAFTCLGVAMTAGLPLVAQGQWFTAALLYGLAAVGFSGGLIFYDALLVGVASRERLHVVSARGYSMGYLGGGLLLALNTLMVTKPTLFGLANDSEAVRASFVCVAVWWALFCIPLFVFVQEPASRGHSQGWAVVREGLRQFISTLRQIRGHKPIFLFLVAYWLYIDGVDTIVRMAVDYGMSLGFTTQSLVVAVLITQFVGFPAALVFGKLGQKIGAKRGILLGLAVYAGITFWGYFMQNERDFFVLAVAVGLVQGGVQALSRSFYASIIPARDSGQYFGFYNVFGKFAAVFGPLLMGFVGRLTHSPRLGILSLLLLFGTGAAVLSAVKLDAAGGKIQDRGRS